MKRTLLTTLLLGIPAVAQAQARFSSLIDSPLGRTGDIGEFFNEAYILLIVAAAMLAVVKIVIAGVKYMVSDVVPTKESAKKDIYTSLFGLVIILGAVVILQTINPQLTDFDFQFQRPEPVDQLQFGSRAANDRICQQYTPQQLRTVSQVNSCDTLPVGWIPTNGFCCGSIDSDQTCCAFNQSIANRLSGNINYGFAQEDVDNNCQLRETSGPGFDSISECEAEVATRQSTPGFQLAMQCDGQQVSDPNIQRIRNLPFCAGSELQTQFQVRYVFQGDDGNGLCHDFIDSTVFSDLDTCLIQEQDILNNNNAALIQNCQGQSVQQPQSRYDAILDLPAC